MIKINLLGDDTVIDQSGRLILLGYVASFAVLLIVFVLLQTSITSKVTQLNDESESLNQRLAQLKKTTDEVRELEKKKNELDLISATIAKLKLSQDGPVRVLDDLNLAVPSKAWLREVEEKNGLITLTGLALNDLEVVSFMKNLEASNYFEAVDLKESASVSLVKISVYNHFNAKFTRYVVRAEEKQLQIRAIQAEAKRTGLKYEVTDGPPIVHRGNGEVKVMSTAKIGADRAQGVESGVFKRGSSRVEKISLWSSVEPVPAKAFTVVARVLYSGKLRALSGEQPQVEEVSLKSAPAPSASQLKPADLGAAATQF